MIVNIDLYGTVRIDINEETGLDSDGVDRSVLMNELVRGTSGPNDVIYALLDEIDDTDIHQVVEVTRNDKVLLTGEGRRMLVVDSVTPGE